MSRATFTKVANFRGLFIALFFGLVVTVVGVTLTATETYALDEQQCLSCHGDPLLTKPIPGGGEIPLFVDEKALDSSAHRFIDCFTCHSSEPHMVDTPLTKQSLAEKCGTCHEYQRKLHLESVHGEQLVQGNPDVATCVDCHSSHRNPHSVVRVLEYNAPAYKKNIAETCAKCHGNEELMENYGIVEKVYESYMRSFHGKAIQLGTYEISQLDKATCTNCHGTHDIQSTSEGTNSPVVGVENLVKTCEPCHPGAEVEFVSGFLGHKDVNAENAPAVFYTEKFFITLTISVVSFGILVVALGLVRWGLNKWKA
jgi:hypothetical protein